MELNINHPAYFKEHYGVDDEVYKFCQKAYIFFKDREYSDTLHIIGITPVAAPQEFYDSGAWKERAQLVCNKSCAIITIRMNFENYYKADSFKKVEQIKETILEAVKRIKSRGKFDFAKFKEDFDLMSLD
ncbi:MAG: hypothetical protein K2K63_04190 [Acetatifactor sp.]|nr:hypothetical protein [Acetatifactor sp.]